MQYICNGTYQSLSATPQKIPIQPKRVPLWAQRAFDGSLLSSVYDWYQGGGSFLVTAMYMAMQLLSPFGLQE